jgi:hypothetical protein
VGLAGVGEGAARVAEELAGGGALGDRREVDGDQGALVAGAGGVDGEGGELLAGAGLAEHEHRQLAGGGHGDLLADAFGGPADADQSVDLARRRGLAGRAR